MGRWLSGAVLLASLLLGGTASGQENLAGAARAFSGAQAAELAGNHEQAAELYELAQQIAPTPEALRGAARTRRAAGHASLAATRASELLRLYPDDAASVTLGREILAVLGPRLALWEVRCSPSCELELDGFAVAEDALDEHTVYMEPGSHALVAKFADGGTVSRTLQAVAGRHEELALSGPAVAPRQEAPGTGQGRGGSGGEVDRGVPEGGGLSPVVVIVGSIATVGLAAAMVWSALDTANAHDLFEVDPTMERYEDGVGREKRTNILIAAASTAGALTLATAIFLTDWGGARQDTATSRRGLRLSGLGLAGTAHEIALSAAGTF